MLLVCRDVFDKKGVWSQKHISRVRELLPQASHNRLHIARLELGFPEEVVNALYDSKFSYLFGIIMGVHT